MQMMRSLPLAKEAVDAARFTRYEFQLGVFFFLGSFARIISFVIIVVTCLPVERMMLPLDVVLCGVVLEYASLFLADIMYCIEGSFHRLWKYRFVLSISYMSWTFGCLFSIRVIYSNRSCLDYY